MTLGWILRAIVRPIVHVHSVDTWFILSRGEDHWSHDAVGLFCNPSDIPERATRRRLAGDLTLAWWGAASPAEKMAIHFSGPLTPESAGEIASYFQGVIGARPSDGGAS